MKYWQLIIFITINLLALPLSAVQKKSFSIRICAYNVECGEGGYVRVTPQKTLAACSNPINLILLPSMKCRMETGPVALVKLLVSNIPM